MRYSTNLRLTSNWSASWSTARLDSMSQTFLRRLPRRVRCLFEIIRPVEIGNESGSDWAPCQPSLRLHAGTDKVATNENPQPSEMGCCLLSGFGHDWHLQAAAYGLSDLPDRHSFFGDRMIPGTRFLLLER